MSTTHVVIDDGPKSVLGVEGKLGRLPVKGDTRALHLARFADLPTRVPLRSRFWHRRAAFPERSFGNLQVGDCTRAKQANAALRMERLETRRTIAIDDAEVIRVYTEMSDRLYGGGDNGAFETDALSEWRKPETTFRDTKGRALTIDAYLRVNPFDHDELRSAMWLAGAHGLAVCLNLPWGFSALNPPADWDIPAEGALVGEWLPGSWGGHSMWAVDYDETGLWLAHTWAQPDQRVTWRAAAAYLDEAHVVIDSWDYWRTKKPEAIKRLDLAGIKRAINKLSSRTLP